MSPLLPRPWATTRIGAALLTLGSAAEVEAAIATTVPDIAGGMRALTVAMTDQATGVIGARQRSLITAPEGTRDEFRFWAQEFYNNVSFNGDGAHTGYGGAGQGLALGAEWGTLGTGRFGAGYTFFSSQQTERHPRETKTNGDWHMLTAYGAWNFGNVYRRAAGQCRHVRFQDPPRDHGRRCHRPPDQRNAEELCRFRRRYRRLCDRVRQYRHHSDDRCRHDVPEPGGLFGNPAAVA